MGVVKGQLRFTELNGDNNRSESLGKVTGAVLVDGTVHCSCASQKFKDLVDLKVKSCQPCSKLIFGEIKGHLRKSDLKYCLPKS